MSLREVLNTGSAPAVGWESEHQSRDARWCPCWAEHPEAVLRLEALWRSWETLRLDAHLGIATWLTSFLDPLVTALTGRRGPFAQCGSGRHQEQAALPSAAVLL
jgi:hypothetical protein